ncbi:MAG: hypothetical protein ABSA93_26770 [Streptosporangiaceae bacterium]
MIRVTPDADLPAVTLELAENGEFIRSSARVIHGAPAREMAVTLAVSRHRPAGDRYVTDAGTDWRARCLQHPSSGIS